MYSPIKRTECSDHHLILDRLSVVDAAAPQNDRSPDHRSAADIAAGLEEDFRPDLATVTERDALLNQKWLHDCGSTTDCSRVDLLRFRTIEE